MKPSLMPMRYARADLFNDTAREALEKQEPASFDAIIALNATHQHLYAGTVPRHVKESRRAANRRARKARRANRR